VDRQKLEQWTAAHGTPQQVALRCRIVLAPATGESDVLIANRFSVNRNTVILWRKRFADEGLDGLWDIAPGRGRKPTYAIDKIPRIVDATLLWHGNAWCYCIASSRKRRRPQHRI